MAEVKPVAWIRFSGYGKATSVHLTEDHVTTLCGREVPRQARPGYREPNAGMFQKVFALDCDDPTEWDLHPDEKGRIPHCRTCLARTTSLDRLA